jgi:hypothetical protein
VEEEEEGEEETNSALGPSSAFRMMYFLTLDEAWPSESWLTTSMGPTVRLEASWAGTADEKPHYSEESRSRHEASAARSLSIRLPGSFESSRWKRKSYWG